MTVSIEAREKSIVNNDSTSTLTLEELQKAIAKLPHDPMSRVMSVDVSPVQLRDLREAVSPWDPGNPTSANALFNGLTVNPNVHLAPGWLIARDAQTKPIGYSVGAGWCWDEKATATFVEALGLIHRTL